jgi:hypothetical protein
MQYYINYLKNNISRKQVFITSSVIVFLSGLGTIGYLVQNGSLPLFEEPNKNNLEKNKNESLNIDNVDTKKELTNDVDTYENK